MNPIRMDPMLTKIRMTGDELTRGLYREVAPLHAVVAVTSEPVPFSERKKLLYRAVETGEEWSRAQWECAWFRITGEVPQRYEPEELFLGIDIDGEGCLFDEGGTPIRGITNVSSEFERSLGLPGKRYVPFEDGSFGTDRIDLWLEAGNNDLLGNRHSGKVLQLGIYYCNKARRELVYDYKFLLSLAEGLSDKDPQKLWILYALEKVAVQVSADDSEQKTAGLREILRPCLERKGPPQAALTFYAIGHSHLDLAWLWPLRETKRKAGRTFSTALANLKLYPDYLYGASQPQQFEWVKELYPQLFAKLKQAVDAGRMEVQGGMWVEADTNITGGESLIRQFWYGKNFWREEFGKEVRTLWLPDVFGFSAALPQIMRGCGCENFLTIKLSWNSVNRFPFHSFRWKGIDGSEVLVHMPPEGTYNSSASPQAVLGAAGEYSERGLSENAMMLYGIGDGGGGPGRSHLEFLQREKDICGLPRVKSATSDEFFASLRKESGKLPEYRGEIYLERHQGTYTSQSRNKRFNRLCERAFSEAEFAFALRGEQDVYGRLDPLWKEVLLYQFHDILPGSSIRRVYEESEARYEAILGELYEMTARCLTEKTEVRSVLNATSFAREEYIKDGADWYYVQAQPFSLACLQKAAPKGSCSAENGCVSNGILVAEFDGNGSLKRLYDKRCGREVLRRSGGFAVYEDSFDAWDMYAGYTEAAPQPCALTEISEVNEGVCAGFDLTFVYGSSVLRQKVRLYENEALLRFETEVDWRETKKMLRAEFEPAVEADEVTCDIQFGNIKRSMRENNSIEWAQFEICAHKWIDVSEHEYGVALLNDCKYGFRAKNGKISINLLRSQMHPCIDQDKGIQRFCYALLPHSGDVYGGGVAKAAYCLNRPLAVYNAAPCGSFVSADSEHAVIETVKPAYDGNGTIVRLYNDLPSVLRTKITSGCGRIFRCDMLEGENVPCGNELRLRPFEIVTLRLCE